MKIKGLFIAAIAFGLAAVSQAATKASGSCESMAIALKASQKVTLVNEYDPEWKENTDSGVAYYKVPLAKYSSCTIWISGGNTADMWAFNCDVSWNLEEFPFATFDYEERDDGATKIAYMRSDSWDADDAAKYTFYVCIQGDIGQTCNLYYQSGIKSFSRVGEEDNPMRLSMTESSNTHSANLIDGSYYYVFNLEAGKKYRVRTIGGTATSKLLMSVDGMADVEADPLFESRTYDTSWLVYPQETADYTFCVYSNSGGENSFKLAYMAFAGLLPEEHANVVELNEANGYSAEIQPGRMVADGTYYYDSVIDESLCKVRVAKGERWAFETSGAKANILMCAYDANGKTLRESTTIGNGSKDARTVIQASYDGYYYVGVCDPALGVFNEPVQENVSIVAYNVDDGEDDAYDSLDDALDGASVMVAYPGAASKSVVTTGRPHGPHTLSAYDWYDCFKLACRKGVTYCIKADFVSAENTSDVGLATVIYKDVNGTRTKVSNSDIRGSLTPDSVSDGVIPLTFTADEDAVYIVAVYTQAGLGLDYPGYNIYAMAYYTGVDLGLVEVNTKGVDGVWTLTGSSAAFENGMTIVAPVGKTTKISFPKVAGYNIQNKNVEVSNVPLWTDLDQDMVTVTGVYTDAYDPADDVVSGYVKITPASTPQNAPRTLWTDDPADRFLFRAVEGCYYNFLLTDTTAGEYVGDAVFSLAGAQTAADLANKIVEDATECSKLRLTPGPYMITVEHGGSPVDSTYVLQYQAVNVGTVGFSPSGAVKVGENDGYAEVKVSRTSSEGAVRVHWATESYTAVPGEDYYPSEGVLSWADGDMSTRTIRIRLIPELFAKHRAMRYFAVKIWPMEDDCLEADEYPATISGASALAVKINDVDVASAGEIVVLNDILQVTAGDVFELNVARRNGSDGRVAVAFVTQNGTALAGTDYVGVRNDFVWEDGDTSVRTLKVETAPLGNLDNKYFRIKAVALTTDEYADCATPAVPARFNVDLVSEVVVKDFAEALAEAQANGVELYNMNSTKWYIDDNGALRSETLGAKGAGKMKFYVTGPGLLVLEPQMYGADYAGGDTLLSQANGSPIVDCSDHTRKVYKIPSGNRRAAAVVGRSVVGGAYQFFSPLENGLPYKYIYYGSSRAVSPANGAIVPLSQAKLEWSKPDGLDPEEVWYRVRVGAKSADPATITTVVASNLLNNTSCDIPFPLKAGRQYWWMLDFAYTGGAEPPSDGDWVASPNVWTFTALPSGGCISKIVSGSDANGKAIVAGETIELVEGVVGGFFLGDDTGTSDSVSLVGGELPPGLKIKSGMRIAGVPSEAGEYEALVNVKKGSVNGTTLALNFHVAPLESGAGKFCGILREDGNGLTNNFPRVGSVSFTASKTGAISAKVSMAGRTYPFSTTSGYSKVLERDDKALGQTMTLYSKLLYTETVAGVEYTSTLELNVGVGSIENPIALGEKSGTAVLELNVPDADMSGVQTGIRYTCDLVRRNSDSETFIAAMQKYAGYYTMSLVPEGADAAKGEPCGNGLVTMTVAEDGGTKVVGRFADGKSYSCSAFANIVGDLGDPDKSVLSIPFAVVTSPYSYGGTIVLRYAEEDIDGEFFNCTYADSRYELEWNKDGPSSTADGSGFSLIIRPTGGYYNEVVNVQRYYLDKDFSVDVEPVNGLPEGMLPDGYVYTVDSVPRSVPVEFIGNTISVPSRQLVKDGSSRYDFANSINPCNVKITFVRATGSVFGTFDVLSDDGNVQKTAAKDCKHYGVLLFTRDKYTPLNEDVRTSGFYLLPVTKDWTLSMPFNIREDSVDPDWSEPWLQ